MSWGALSPIIFGVKECDYCAPSCTAEDAGTRAIQADEFCKTGTWDVSDVGPAIKKKWFGGKEQFRGDGSDGRALMCCTLNDNTAEPPKFYLTKNLRTPTEDIEAQGDVTLPRVRAYFGDEVRPVRNGENIDVVSNQEYAYEIELYQIDEDFDITNYFCDLRLLNRFNDDLLKREGNQISPVLSAAEANQEVTSARCDNLFSKQGDKEIVDDITVLMPSEYEGESLTFQLLITEDSNTQENEEGKVRYDPETDVLYRNTFNVINPIQFNNYDSNWVREQTLSVSCKGISCSRFFWKKGVCNPDDTSGFKEADYSSNGNGFFTVDSSLVDGNVGELNVCVIGETAGKNYTKTTPRSIGIDADAPSVRGVFNPLFMHTNITCTETGQSGCAPQVGYHYIRRAVDFVGAAFTNNDASFCPDDLREYTFIPARQTGENTVSTIVPYVGGQDFMIMCVVGEDNAGNIAKDIVFNYNSYNILMTVVNSQLEEGGVGTGYHGYNYG